MCSCAGVCTAETLCIAGAVILALNAELLDGVLAPLCLRGVCQADVVHLPISMSLLFSVTVCAWNSADHYLPASLSFCALLYMYFRSSHKEIPCHEPECHHLYSEELSVCVSDVIE